MSVQKAYKYWRIAGTGFSFAVFGLGAFFIALLLLLILYPFPLNRKVKQRWTRHMVWRSTWFYVRMMRFLGLLTFEFQNTEYLREGGQLIIANHPSLLDVVFLLSAIPSTNCIVKSALFKNPFTFGLVSLAGYISNNNNGEDLIIKAAETLKQGQTLIIFPEGTRTQNFDNLIFKRGAANVALKAQCKIRPVLIDCHPITLRKNEKWYNVPETPPHFTLKALPLLQIDQCIDVSRPTTVQARHLTQFLHDTYTSELSSNNKIAQVSATH